MVNPTRGTGQSRRPLTRRDIETAQSHTRSGAEAARWLNVDYTTYRKYARMYDLHERHKNPAGRGMPRKVINGMFGLKSLLAGEHPNYDRRRLKERLVRAGYLPEACSMCGFKEKRIVDGRCPLILHHTDTNRSNFALDNIDLRCLNCTYLTTGKVTEKQLVNFGVSDADLLERLTMDDIAEIQNSAWDDLDEDSDDSEDESDD
jgi:hypothetical protein